MVIYLRNGKLSSDVKKVFDQSMIKHPQTALLLISQHEQSLKKTRDNGQAYKTNQPQSDKPFDL